MPAASRGRRILHICSGSVAQGFDRNGLGLYTERELSDFEGFFEHVYAVSFPAGTTSEFALTPRHTLFDFDVVSTRWRWLPRPLRAVSRFAAFIRWTIAFVRDHDIAIVQSTDPYFRGLAALLVAKLTGTRYGVLVTRDYDMDYEQLGKHATNGALAARSLEKLIERLVFRYADVVVADRAYYAEYAIRNGARPVRVGRSWVLVDKAYTVEPDSRPRLAADLGLPRKNLLVYVGRLSAEKHVADAVRCLASVRLDCPDAHLLFAGTGPLEAEIASLGTELGVRDGLHFLGSQRADRLAALLTTADVVIGTHMGYTLVEAALSGTPIVAYDYEWHPEVIRHLETGILVPFGDYEQMAEWVVRLIHEPALAQRLGHAAREFVLTEHRPAKAMRRYREIYEPILAAAKA